MVKQDRVGKPGYRGGRSEENCRLAIYNQKRGGHFGGNSLRGHIHLFVATPAHPESLCATVRQDYDPHATRLERSGNQPRGFTLQRDIKRL
jgi:hypothetical protein